MKRMGAVKDAKVAMVSEGAPWARAHADALRAAGAQVTLLPADAALWFALSRADIDAVVLADLDGGPKALARALHEDPTLRTLPVLVLMAPGAAEEPSSSLVAAAVVVPGEDPGATVPALEALVAASRPTRPRGPERESGESPELHRDVEGRLHDLRVLLDVIIGYGANLRDGLDGALTELQRDHIRRMLDAANDASALLDETRSPSGTMPVGAVGAAGVSAPPRPDAPRFELDIGALTASVVRMFERTAEERGVELSCAAAEPIWLWGAAVELRQVVANLVVNALKFSPRGGRVRVAVRLSGSDFAEVVVSDTGPGVPLADRERIFGYGVRLPRDARIAGTGIGLAVVRDLVGNHHGGTVCVRDAEGGGAEFVVTLPLDWRADAQAVSSRRGGGALRAAR